MIFAVVSLFILAFVQMLALGQLQERVVNLEKVVLALSMVTKMDKFKKGLKDKQ
ncbi:hypothetical protein [Solobacterium moorei]|uniref:hypothetical protein n=1 Tax=Solobacterium moorei TaxID=102148 RepID=UPI000411CAC6|nr:hypothetical protein [Solobacterium moorei]BET21233.1 hypothetical protein RGT18_08210 [Solobacterium moorei]